MMHTDDMANPSDAASVSSSTVKPEEETKADEVTSSVGPTHVAVAMNVFQKSSKQEHDMNTDTTTQPLTSS